MNGKDRQWFEARFDKLDEALDKHGERLACLETKWNMATKFFGVVSGAVALTVSAIISMFWR